MRIKHFVATNVFGEDAKRVRVTSLLGTDVTYSVEGRIFIPALREPGWDPLRAYRRTEEGRKASPLYACLYPTGEFNVPPVEGSAEGKVVIDLTMHHLGRLQSPVELTVREGRIVTIEGGADAWTLKRYLEKYGDENATLFPTEASIGINRMARLVGCQREDKNMFGAIHFGLGTNIDVGGSVRSNIHMDGVMLAPTVEIDGEIRIRGGEFLVPLDA